MDSIDQKVLSEINDTQPESYNGITAKNATLSTEEESLIASDAAKELQYGNNAAKAASLGAADMATLGLSNQFLTKSGLVKPETIKELQERNETAYLLGQTAGAIAPALASGGTSLAAKGVQLAAAPATAVIKASILAEKALAKVLAEQGSKSIAKSIIAKSLPKVAGSAVEGAAYGIGQLISEDALGTNELNAENALAAAGIGALLGGTVGGMFAAPASLLPIVTKNASKLKDISTNKFAKLTDPTESALDLYGITPTQRAKLKSKNSTFIAELPQWTVEKTKLGLFTGTEKLKNNLQSVKEEAGKQISNVINKIDTIAESNPALLPSAKSVYANIAQKIDENIISEYKNVPGFKNQITPVVDLKTDFINLAKQEGQVKTSDIHNLRVKIDSLIKFDKQPGTYTLKEQALNDIRNLLNDEISNIAEKADLADVNKSFGSLLKELKTANKDYSYASRLLPSIDKKVEKDAAKKALGLTDLMAVTSGEILSEGLGGAVVLGKKFLESDFRRRAAVLANIEKQNQTAENAISSGLQSFFSNKLAKSVPAIKSSTTNILIRSKLSEDSKNRKPTSTAEGFKNISNRISELLTNNEKLEKTLSTRTMGINQVAPNTALEITTTAVKALNFLNSKLPKPAADLMNKDKFTKREYTPSELVLAKFTRYLEAVENPLSALDDLKSGTLTSEKVEVLQQIYPQIYLKMQEKAMEIVETSKEPISYSKRLQLGILLNIPTDESLKPENIAGLQTSFVQSEQKVPTKQARAESLSMAERTETQANKIAQQ